MAFTIEDYYSHPHWDPVSSTFLQRHLEQNLVRPWWVEQRVSEPRPLAVAPALPGARDHIPSVANFQPETNQAPMGPFLPLHFDQKPAWDTFGFGILQRDPYFEPLWSDLTKLGQGNSWDRYQQSREFDATVETLGLRGRGLLDDGLRLLERGAKAAVRYTPKAVKVVTGIPNPTPFGVGVWLAKELAVNAILDYMTEEAKKQRKPPKNPRPPIRPPHQKDLAFSIVDDIDYNPPMIAPIAPVAPVYNDVFDDIANVLDTAVDTVGDVIDASVNWMIGVADYLFR